MPRFEYQDAKSHKFWEIEREGNTFTVRYGRVGTDGQTNTKVFDSDDKAQRELEKMISKKTKKGYAEVAAVERAPEPGSNPELEAAITDDPSNDEAWMVYADWLQGQDDPRGALIVAHANGNSGNATRLLQEHSKDFLGRFAPDKDLEPYAELDWDKGFWKSVKVSCDYDTAEDMPESISGIASVVGHVLRHPSAKFLQKLSLGLVESFIDGEADWQDSVDAVVKNGIRPSLRTLFVGDFERVDDTEISWTSIGNLAGIWSVLPELTELTVQGCGIELGTIDAPKLTTLKVWSGGLGKEPVTQIGKATFPELQHLEIWFGTEDYGGACSADDTAPILEGTGLPKVTWLGLMNSDFANDLPGRVVNSKILPRLKVLDLSMGTMTDEGARVLLANADKLKHLDKLNLEENFISDEVAQQLVAALPNVDVSSQEDADDWVYVSVGE